MSTAAVEYSLNGAKFNPNESHGLSNSWNKRLESRINSFGPGTEENIEVNLVTNVWHPTNCPVGGRLWTPTTKSM